MQSYTQGNKTNCYNGTLQGCSILRLHVVNSVTAALHASEVHVVSYLLVSSHSTYRGLTVL